MFLSELTIKNFRMFGQGKNELRLQLKPGLTALVGENDSGKSAIIDAIRYALQTRDQGFIRIQPEDLHIPESGPPGTEIIIRCKFESLSLQEQGAFAEYLAYEQDAIALYLNWTAQENKVRSGSRRWFDIKVRSGKDASGPTFEAGARALLWTTYLRPLRDAEKEMSPGRGSRLSQILYRTENIRQGEAFNPENSTEVDPKKLSLVGISDFSSHHIRSHKGILSAQNHLNKDYLKPLTLHGDNLRGEVSVAGAENEDMRLRQILEKLDLRLRDGKDGKQKGRYGLGSNNILFMACELLLLGGEPEGLPLLLIEEPEAHLHPQRQLRLIEFLGKEADEGDNGRQPVQILVTTHSPNLASKIPLKNMILIQSGQAFPLAEEFTELGEDDYRFLERFLDVTKANLFFARGVMIVEGAAEAILIPTLARLIDRDFTEHGVSIVNVGGTGLRRYSKIFQRKKNEEKKKPIPIDVQVACLADMDVMPDCAPEILGIVEDVDDIKWEDKSKRKWLTKRDFGEGANRKAGLDDRRKKLAKDDGQFVRTFIADEWTLEYDLAFHGLAKDVFIAASLAKNDNALNEEKKKREDVEIAARKKFEKIASECNVDKEQLSTRVYLLFKKERASKAIAAQYLAEILHKKVKKEKLSSDIFQKKLPPYIVDAIKYVTGEAKTSDSGTEG